MVDDRQEINRLAVVSLVLGLVWLYGIASILGLILGYVAKRQIDQSGGGQRGRGLAVAGIAFGWLGVAGLVVMGVVYLFFGSMDPVVSL